MAFKYQKNIEMLEIPSSYKNRKKENNENNITTFFFEYLKLQKTVRHKIPEVKPSIEEIESCLRTSEFGEGLVSIKHAGVYVGIEFESETQAKLLYNACAEYALLEHEGFCQVDKNILVIISPLREDFLGVLIGSCLRTSKFNEGFIEIKHETIGTRGSIVKIRFESENQAQLLYNACKKDDLLKSLEFCKGGKNTLIIKLSLCKEFLRFLQDNQHKKTPAPKK